jgi:hypothetical protein
MTEPRFSPRHFKGDLVPIGGSHVWFYGKYRIKHETLLAFGVKKVFGVLGAFYFPVLGPELSERGGIVRYFSGDRYGPKAVSFKASDKPWQAWFVNEHPHDMVVVEDVLSAMRCYQLGYVAIALLGTNLSRAKEREIVECAAGDKVLLALDNDAFGRAIKVAQRNPRFIPILLDRDLKDITDEEILEVLEVGRD